MTPKIDKQFLSMTIDKIKDLILKEKRAIRKDYEQLQKKQKLFQKYKKLQEVRRKIKQGKILQKKHPTIPIEKTFEDYFDEYKKTKIIPPDTPYYLLNPLKNIIKEHENGIELEKSALNGFVKKYIIKGIPGITFFQFLIDKKKVIKDFLINNTNIKLRLILVCLMEKKEDDKLGIKNQDKVYFHSNTHIYLTSTDVKKLLNIIFREIIENINNYVKNGSGWYFKEILYLEIHTIEYKPISGSTYIPLPDWIKSKKAIVSIRNKDNKCFIWSILRYLYPRDKNDCRFNDLKKYEFSLNTKGITFPMKLKDISKFEKLNPDLPGINVFSVDDTYTIYPLRQITKNCKSTIDLFLYEQYGQYHYSLIKNLSRLIRSQITSRTNPYQNHIYVTYSAYIYM